MNMGRIELESFAPVSGVENLNAAISITTSQVVVIVAEGASVNFRTAVTQGQIVVNSFSHSMPNSELFLNWRMRMSCVWMSLTVRMHLF